MRFVHWNEDESDVIANVYRPSSILSTVDVALNKKLKTMKCMCKFNEETGIICKHAAALFSHEEALDANDVEWYESR